MTKWIKSEYSYSNGDSIGLGVMIRFLIEHPPDFNLMMPTDRKSPEEVGFYLSIRVGLAYDDCKRLEDWLNEFIDNSKSPVDKSKLFPLNLYHGVVYVPRKDMLYIRMPKCDVEKFLDHLAKSIISNRVERPQDDYVLSL